MPPCFIGLRNNVLYSTASLKRICLCCVAAESCILLQQSPPCLMHCQSIQCCTEVKRKSVHLIELKPRTCTLPAGALLQCHSNLPCQAMRMG